MEIIRHWNRIVEISLELSKDLFKEQRMNHQCPEICCFKVKQQSPRINGADPMVQWENGRIFLMLEDSKMCKVIYF